MRTFSASMQKASISAFYHDIRDGKIPTYVDQSYTINNELSISNSDEAIENFKNELMRIQDAYILKNGRPPRKFQSKQSLLQEVVLSINENVTMEQVKKCAMWLEKTHGFKMLLAAIHKDEGEDVRNGKINYHAHIVLLNLDQNCKSIRRRLKISDMKEMQTNMAKICGMKRGTNYSKDIGGPAKKHTTHLSGREFAAMANAIKNAQPGSALEEVIKLSSVYQGLAKHYLDLIDVFIAVKEIVEENQMILQERYERFPDLPEDELEFTKCSCSLATDIKDIVFFIKQDLKELGQICRSKNSQITNLRQEIKIKFKQIDDMKNQSANIQTDENLNIKSKERSFINSSSKASIANLGNDDTSFDANFF